MYQEYQKNPAVTKQRMYFEAMEDVLPGLKIVVDNGNGVQKMLPLEPFSSESENEDEAVSQSQNQGTQQSSDNGQSENTEG